MDTGSRAQAVGGAALWGSRLRGGEGAGFSPPGAAVAQAPDRSAWCSFSGHGPLPLS